MLLSFMAGISNLKQLLKNLSYLSQLIRSTGADFGIAHDGDADHCVVDEQRVVLPLDVQLAMMTMLS